MRKTIVILLIIALVVVAIGAFLYFCEPAATVEPAQSGEIVEIPIDTVRGITPREAEELCHEILGDADAETGFLFSFGVSGAVEQDGKQYYVVRISWLVNGDHLSYIGDFFVSADGTEVYNGFAKPGQYSIEERIRQK